MADNKIVVIENYGDNQFTVDALNAEGADNWDLVKTTFSVQKDSTVNAFCLFARDPVIATAYDGDYDEMVGPVLGAQWQHYGLDPFFSVNNGHIWTPTNQDITTFLYIEHTDPVVFDVYTKATLVNADTAGDYYLYFDISNAVWNTGDIYVGFDWDNGTDKYQLNLMAAISPGVTENAQIDSPGNSNVIFIRVAFLDGIKARVYYAVPGDIAWTEWEYPGNCVLSGDGTMTLTFTSNNPTTCTSTIHYFRNNLTNPLF